MPNMSMPPPLYDVKLIIKKNHHYYLLGDDSTWHQGVTGILDVISKYALLPWTAKVTSEYIIKILRKVQGKNVSERFYQTLQKRAKKQSRFIKEAAGRIGTCAHERFDKFIKEGIPLVKNSPYETSFNYWLKNEKLIIIQGDTKVGSKIYSYGGSLDAVAMDEYGNFWIIDFKTGKNIYDSYAYQLGAYGQAFMETYGLEKFPNGVVVRFDPEKEKFERREIYYMKASFDTFIDAKNILDAQKQEQFSKIEKSEDKNEKNKNLLKI